jgi:hypothetical protein
LLSTKLQPPGPQFNPAHPYCNTIGPLTFSAAVSKRNNGDTSLTEDEEDTTVTLEDTTVPLEDEDTPTTVLELIKSTEELATAVDVADDEDDPTMLSELDELIAGNDGNESFGTGPIES